MLRAILGIFAIYFFIFLANPSLAQEGPSSIVETYKDWTVRCVPQDKKRVCQLVQELAQQKSGQRVLSFVIDTPKKQAKGAEATVLAPFGLKLVNGLQLSIDSEKVGSVFSFSTCIPLGCLAPVKLDEPSLQKMREGNKLAMSMVSIANGKVVNVELSLGGFTAAYKRLKELS